MNNQHEHWQKIISQHKPHKLHGELWYRSVYKTRRNSIMNMDTALLEQLGINPDELCRDEWELTQELGKLIREAGFEGAVVPSAAGPYRNLVLFPDCFSSKSSIELKDVHPLFINDKQD